MASNGDGNNVINIDLDSRDEYINLYDDDRISDDLHNYIIDRAMEVGNKGRIVIRVSIKFKCNDEERDNIRRMIICDIENGCASGGESRPYGVCEFYFCLIGIGCIIVSFMFSYLHFSLVSEIFMVIGWVALWEVVENVMFVEREDRLKRRKYLQLKRATIVFD